MFLVLGVNYISIMCVLFWSFFFYQTRKKSFGTCVSCMFLKTNIFQHHAPKIHGFPRVAANPIYPNHEHIMELLFMRTTMYDYKIDCMAICHNHIDTINLINLI